MRVLWKGSIGFGLVNIPVSLYSATEESNLAFVSLDKKTKSRVRYKKVSETTGKEISQADIVKAYPTGGQFVIMEEEDFDKALPEKKDHIDIVQFVKEEEIDPIYYEKPYYLIPDKGAGKPYHLLIKAMEETKTVGLAEFMLRNRMHMCALKSQDGVLLLNQLRYHEEIREAPEVPAAKNEKISAREVMAVTLAST